MLKTDHLERVHYGRQGQHFIDCGSTLTTLFRVVVAAAADDDDDDVYSFSFLLAWLESWTFGFHVTSLGKLFTHMCLCYHTV